MSTTLHAPPGTVLLAQAGLEVDTATLRQRVREALGAPLRRAGAQVELAVAGAHACLAALPDGTARDSVGVLWTSRAGVRAATATVLEELCLRAEPPLPFDFLATQAALAAIPLQQALPTLDTALYLPWTGDEALRWPRMLQLAALQLRAGRHTLMLCGTVEPGEALHCCHWAALARA